MTDKQIDYVLAIAKTRSISKAAEMLSITQPYLSQYLSNLESELGYKLFDRSSYPLGITVQGEVYIDIAKQIRSLESELTDRIDCLSDNNSETISVAIPSHICFGVMPSVLSTFRQKYPKCKINIISETKEDYVEMLKSGQLDYFVSALEKNDSNIDYLRVKATKLIVAAPASFDLIHDGDDSSDAPYPMADIKKMKNYPYIQIMYEGDIISTKIREAANSLSFDIDPSLTIDSYFFASKLIECEMGLSIIPATCVDMLYPTSKIKYYMLPIDRLSKNVRLYYRKKAFLTEAKRDFRTILFEALKMQI